jgi:hypothetical protein
VTDPRNIYCSDEIAESTISSNNPFLHIILHITAVAIYLQITSLLSRYAVKFKSDENGVFLEDKPRSPKHVRGIE